MQLSVNVCVGVPVINDLHLDSLYLRIPLSSWALNFGGGVYRKNSTTLKDLTLEQCYRIVGDL